MNFLNVKDVERIDEKLTEIVKGQYSYADGILFAEVEKVEITYDPDPFVTLTIHYGRYEATDETQNFDHKFDLVLLKIDDHDFIAGQFYQKIMDENL